MTRPPPLIISVQPLNVHLVLSKDLSLHVADLDSEVSNREDELIRNRHNFKHHRTLVPRWISIQRDRRRPLLLPAHPHLDARTGSASKHARVGEPKVLGGDHPYFDDAATFSRKSHQRVLRERGQTLDARLLERTVKFLLPFIRRTSTRQPAEKRIVIPVLLQGVSAIRRVPRPSFLLFVRDHVLGAFHTRSRITAEGRETVEFSSGLRCLDSLVTTFFRGVSLIPQPSVERVSVPRLCLPLLSLVALHQGRPEAKSVATTSFVVTSSIIRRASPPVEGIIVPLPLIWQVLLGVIDGLSVAVCVLRIVVLT
mmetsp:Transcript_734/g.2018  ORF Transcript_734/g.2018 Transcript_734/m.2018 type:complete len:311 (-) Transcript_734:1715-2647(-)